MEITNRQVRGWLVNIYSPGALGADPAMRALLDAHRRPTDGSDLAVSRVARQFLREMVARLAPEPGAKEQAWRPYQALVLSCLEGHSHHTCARLMALSSRQFSREVARAIRLLRQELENP